MPPKPIAVILGGGRGVRLRPLTDARSKPAVPFAGKYRLVDIPITNCIHAGINRIFVLTQYLSASLNRHVAQSYRFDSFTGGHVEVLAAEQTPNAGSDWYQGTADAVRKQLRRLDAGPDDTILILSGDQVYLMDLAELVRTHNANGAEVTVAATRVSREAAHRFGVMSVNAKNSISGFAEKPTDAETLDAFEVPKPVDGLTHLASMGIYAFRYSVLEEMLASDPREDFGKHIVPSCLGTRRLLAYPYYGYWEDVGTIASYHSVNLHLTDPVPAFNLFDGDHPLFARPRFLPPAKLGRVTLDGALVCDGAIIGDGCNIRRSIIGIRTVISPGCTLDRVVANGAGRYDLDDAPDSTGVPLGVGRNSVLRNVILDRDARVGRDVRLTNEGEVDEYADEHIVVSGGIIVVRRKGYVPDGYTF